MKTKNKLYIAIFNLIFSGLVVLLSFGCFAWLSANKQTGASAIQVYVKPQMQITVTKYYYDHENEQFLSSQNTSLIMADYDSIFTDENTNLDVVLELQIDYALLTNYDNCEIILSRQNHNDQTSQTLTTYVSSIITVSTYQTVNRESTNELIWSSAVVNKENTTKFISESNNTYIKTSYLDFSLDISDLQENTSTIYIYLIFSYSSTEIELYNQQSDIFEHGEISEFLNDLVSLEVMLS